MSAHPAPRATRSIRAETAGSSSLALGPNQRGKAGGEVEASIPDMAMAHQRTRGKVPRRAWPNLAATPRDKATRGQRTEFRDYRLRKGCLRQNRLGPASNAGRLDAVLCRT